jgi:XTP/dITP diphosphohydrolase
LTWAKLSKSELTRERIILATSNPGKLREIKEYLAGLPAEFLSLRDLGAGKEVKEKGQSFLENARLKSLAWSLKSEFLVLAEDSGLEVCHLEGAPGIFSARFSAPRATDEKNIRKLLRLMEGASWSQRQAKFVSCAVLSRKGKIIKEVKGQVRGYVAFEKKGNRGFGYDPVFFYSPQKRTFGQLTPAEKNKVSHRGRALMKMKAFLMSYLGHPEKK